VPAFGPNMIAASKATVRLLARPLVVVTSLALAAVTLPSPASAAPARSSARSLVDASPLLGPLRVLSSFGIATSLWRSAEHNRRVGGMPNSYHLTGRAIDVQRRPGVSHAMLDAMLRKAGFVPIESIDEIDHSHFAFLPAGAKTTASQPKITTVAPTPPPKIIEPRLAADLHGTLLIDTAKTAAAGAPIAAPDGSAPSSTAAN